MPVKLHKLLYVVNIPRFFVSHRLPLALAAREAGFEVHVATSTTDRASSSRIADVGLPLHSIPLSQHGINPLAELQTVVALRRLYGRLRPDLLHHVSMKPVLYGGIAARICGIQNIVHSISGLGYVFSSDETKAKLLRMLAPKVFRIAAAGSRTRVIFQNPDDLGRFVEGRLIADEQAVLIRGSGVDETRFHESDEPGGEMPVVLFAGRLLWKKGLGDFVELARRLRGRARFRVVGYEEATSPLNVPAAQLRAWADEGIIEWQGKRDDMPQVYAESNIVCLPSTYGEGVPKVLIEAASCGRACVATDTPGCREIVRHGCNGLLAPPNDIDALAAAVARLIESPSLRVEMGANGRRIVLGGFTLKQVVKETLAVYQNLLEA